MKRIGTLIIAALVCVNSLFAATPLTEVKGQVVDAVTGEGEPYATYKIWKGNRVDSPVVMTITDEDGHIAAQIKGTGEFTILVTSLGRKDIRKTFEISGSEGTIDLGVIPFEDDMQTLASSTVTALRPLVKMEVDKMTYSVEDDVDSKSSTVLDMLRKVPMVTVDGQDNITVNGSSSFQVLIDGKPNAMISGNASTVFKSMPASYVKNIEVVTNPGVKYDAEGVGGILNITTVRSSSGSTVNLDGYNATVGLMGSNRGGSARAFVSAQKGKFSLSANVSAMRMNLGGTETETTREQLDNAGNVLSTLESSSSLKVKTPANMASINLGYEIDTLRLVSASFGYMNFGSNSAGDMTTAMTLTGFPTMSYNGKSESVWDTHSITAGADYQRTWAGNKARMLTLSYQFSASPSVTDSRTIFETSTLWTGALPGRYTDGSTNAMNHTVQADFTTPLSKELTLNAGAKYINRRNISSQKLYLDDVYSNTGSMEYTHLSNIVAGYGEFSFNREKWGAKAGARYEHTFQDVSYALGNGTDFSLDYGNFVPTASLQYNLSMLSNVGLSYNMRISRPGITYLNPYVDISDPTARTYGNTNLETETAHNVNLVYNFFSPFFMVNATLRHTFSPNTISPYSFYDDKGILNTTYGNIVKSSVTGLNTFLNINLSNKTRIMANASVNYTDLRSDALSQSNKGWSGNVFGGVQQTIPWDVRVSANVMYSSPRISLQGKSGGMTMFMGGLTKTFLSDKLSVGLNGMIPLVKGGKLVRRSETSGADYNSVTVTTVPMSQIMLNVSYSFGNSKITSAKKAKKSIKNDDVMDRSNGTEEIGNYIGM